MGGSEWELGSEREGGCEEAGEFEGQSRTALNILLSKKGSKDGVPCPEAPGQSHAQPATAKLTHC